MESNEMNALDEEKMNQVSGGSGVSQTDPDYTVCPYCKRGFITDTTERKRWFDDHVEECERRYGRA